MTKEQRKAITRYVKNRPTLTYDEIAKKLNVSRATVTRAMRLEKLSRPRGRKLINIKGD